MSRTLINLVNHNDESYREGLRRLLRQMDSFSFSFIHNEMKAFFYVSDDEVSLGIDNGNRNSCALDLLSDFSKRYHLITLGFTKTDIVSDHSMEKKPLDILIKCETDINDFKSADDKATTILQLLDMFTNVTVEVTKGSKGTFPDRLGDPIEMIHFGGRAKDTHGILGACFGNRQEECVKQIQTLEITY